MKNFIAVLAIPCFILSTVVMLFISAIDKNMVQLVLWGFIMVALFFCKILTKHWKY